MPNYYEWQRLSLKEKKRLRERQLRRSREATKKAGNKHSTMTLEELKEKLNAK